MPFCELDARPGGLIHFCHQLADGTKIWVKAVFDEVRAPEFLAFTGGFVDDAGNPGVHPLEPDWPKAARMQTLIELAEEAPGTRVTVRQRIVPADLGVHPSVQWERKLARDGWADVLDHLAAHLADKEVGA